MTATRRCLLLLRFGIRTALVCLLFSLTATAAIAACPDHNTTGMPSAVQARADAGDARALKFEAWMATPASTCGDACAECCASLACCGLVAVAPIGPLPVVHPVDAHSARLCGAPRMHLRLADPPDTRPPIV